MDIKIGGQSIYKVSRWTYDEPHMGIRRISMTVNYPSDAVVPSVDAPVFEGAYVEYNGERFLIENAKPTAEKTTSTINYIYTLSFVGGEQELTTRIVRDLAEASTDAFVSQGTTFPFHSDVSQYVDLLRNNIRSYFGSEWEIRLNTTSSKVATIEIDNQTIWDLLCRVHELFDLRFRIDGRVIHIGYEPDVIEHTFDYMVDGGLVKITRSAQSEQTANRLIGMGGERNIPMNYFTDRYPDFPTDPNPISKTANIRNLMPKVFRDSVKLGQLPYVDYVQDDALVAEFGVRELALDVNEEIYPSIAGYVADGIGRIDEIVDAEVLTIDDVEDEAYKKTFDIWVKDLGFDLKDNRYTTTKEAKISFTSGMLSGYEFTILAINGARAVEPDTSKTYGGVSSAYRITLINSDEELDASGLMIPNSVVKAVAGDTFVIYDIEMPQQYVEYAEARLEDWMREQLDERKVEKPTYTIEPMDMFFETHTEPETDGMTIKQKMRAGNVLGVLNKYITDGIQALHISHISIKYGEHVLPKYTITISDNVGVGGILQNKLKELENKINGQSYRFSTLKKTIETTFKDGVLTDTELIVLRARLNDLARERDDVEAGYQSMIDSEYLTDDMKRLLGDSYNLYLSAYNVLVSSIESAVADGTITDSERDSVAILLDDYAEKLKAYRQQEEEIRTSYIGVALLKDNLKAYAREQAQIEAQYPKIEANVYLVEPHKTAFQEAMSAYRTAYNGVVGAINRALADGKLTPEELAEVARYQTAYAEALGRYYEAEETARGAIDAERERQSQEYSERQWQDLKDTQEALISAGLANFTENISPISVQTMQLIAGDESLQYYFVESKLNPVRVSHSVKYDAQTKKLTAYRGIIKHYTIGQTAMTPEANRVYRFWDAPQMTSAELETGKVHWLYIKADKASESASFVVSDKAIKMEEVSGYYHLLVGLLNPERNGTRSFAPLYGYTEILPNRITVDRIVSQDGKTSFDLVKGEIKGNLSITSGGTEYRIPADRGAFVSGTTYYFNDRVSHNGSLWLCVVSQTNTAPSDTNPAWVKHVAKGDKGDKGDKGLSVSLVDVEFAVGASPTIAPSTGWNTTAPSLTDGQYLWTRTKTTYTSGNPTYTQAVNITPQTGTGVESVTEEYAISTSKTTQPPTGWSTTQPSWVQGSYIWSRVKVVYKNPSSTIYTGYSVSSEWEAVNNLEVGGRNLLLNSNFKFGKRNWLDVNTLIEDDEFGTVSKSETSSYAGVTNKPTASLIVGKLYTLSCYAKSDVDGVKFGLAYDGNGLERGTRYDLTTKWKRYVHTIAYNGVNLNCRFYGIGVFYIANVQLEEGNMVTAYSEAPEDVQARIEQLRIDTYTDLEVTKDSINAVAGRTTTLENADEAINTRLQSAESSIKINTNNIALKASQTEVNGLKTRMSTAEQKITPTAITSTVRNSSEYKGDINNLQSQITQTADSISLKVSASEVDEKIAGIQVGGENLIQQRYINSHTPYNTKPIIDGKGTLRSTYVQASGLFTISLSNYTPKGWHTVSGVMTINGNPVTRNMYTSKRATTYEGVVGKFVVDDATGRFEISQEWGVHSSTQWIFHVNIGAVKGDVIEIREFMFQKGTKATAYAPSVEEARHQQGKIRYIRDWLNGNSENTGNHWIEIAAYDKLVANKAHGKPVSSDKNITNISRITDGKTNEVDSYAYTSATSALTSVTVDLLDWFEIDKVKVWHYYGDGRTYNNTKTEVSQDGVNWVTLFDSAREGTYPETSAGRTYPVSEEAKAKAYTDSTKNTLQSNLKDTGIDILNRKIVLMADNVEMRDNWGNLNAMFSSDWTKIRAEAIELSGTEASGGKTKVTVDGTLYAENANISGTITATSGSIGGFGISGSELTSNENSLAISGGSGTITLRKDGDTRLVMKPDNLATSPSNYFSGGGQKIISALNGMWTAIGDRNGSTTYIDCSDGKTYEANVPQIVLNTHVIIMSDEGNASVDIRAELTNGSKVIQLGYSFVGATKGRDGSPSTGGGATTPDGEGIDNTTIPPSKVTITESGNWYVRVRCNEIKSSGTSISQEYKISMLSYITVNPVVNRSELGANGMMIATSATAYTYMVGDTFQVRRGNYCLRVTNTGIQKSSDGGSTWTNL